SRRRHTRWPRDWSSDVCSSDLPAIGGQELSRQCRAALRDADATCRCYAASAAVLLGNRTDAVELLVSTDTTDVRLRSRAFRLARSEERRVGKEGRDRYRSGHSK